MAGWTAPTSSPSASTSARYAATPTTTPRPTSTTTAGSTASTSPSCRRTSGSRSRRERNPPPPLVHVPERLQGPLRLAVPLVLLTAAGAGLAHPLDQGALQPAHLVGMGGGEVVRLQRVRLQIVELEAAGGRVGGAGVLAARVEDQLPGALLDAVVEVRMVPGLRERRAEEIGPRGIGLAAPIPSDQRPEAV